MGGTGRAVTGWKWVVSFPPPTHRPRYSWWHGSLSPQNMALSGIQSWSERFMCRRMLQKTQFGPSAPANYQRYTMRKGTCRLDDGKRCNARSSLFRIISLFCNSSSPQQHNTLPTSTIPTPLHTRWSMLRIMYLFQCYHPCTPLLLPTEITAITYHRWCSLSEWEREKLRQLW